MPIIGMTRRQDVNPQFPDLGKLRKGAPKTTNRPGVDLEYWRFTSDRPEITAAFYAAYPLEPKTIHAYLPFSTTEENWNTWREEYDAGGLVHRCDGETVLRYRDSSGQYQDRAMPCPYANGKRERTKEYPGCIQVGRLALIIPELIEVGHVGFVTMETHSINDLVSITACLTDIERHSPHGLTGILLNVMRVPEVISTPAWDAERKTSGKRNRTLKFLVQVVPAAEWVQAQLAQAKLLALPGATLPELTDEDSVDAEVTIAKDEADVMSGGVAAEVELDAVRSVSDIVNSLMREAAERDGADPQSPKPNGLEAVWNAYVEHGFHPMEATAITNIIFPGGIKTHGQAATLYFWLREPDPTDATGKRYRSRANAAQEAAAILTAVTIMTADDKDLPFSDEPEDEDA